MQKIVTSVLVFGFVVVVCALFGALGTTAPAPQPAPKPAPPPVPLTFAGTDARKKVEVDRHVTSLSFSPDGKKLLGVGLGVTLFSWPEMKPLAAFKTDAMSAAFLNDDVIVGANNGVRFMDVVGKMLADFPYAQDSIGRMEAAPINTTVRTAKGVVTVSMDGVAKLWSAPGEKSKMLAEFGVLSMGASVTNDAGLIAICTNQSKCLVSNGGRSQVILPHKDVSAVALSTDSKTLALGHYDGSLTVIDFTMTTDTTKVGLKERCVIKAEHTKWVRKIAFAPDGGTIASIGEDDATVKLWDAKTGKLLGQRTFGKPGWACMAFSPDGTRLVTGGEDKKVRIWTLVPAEDKKEEKKN